MKAWRRKRGISTAEIAVLAVAAVVLAAFAVPLWANYTARAAGSAVRGDLKSLHSSVEAYYTENLDVPAGVEAAVPGWSDGLSQKYSYTRRGPHSYEFRSREKTGGAYLYIDQRGTVEESP